MCQRRGVIEIDLAGSGDTITDGSALNGCGCVECTCRDKREKAGKDALADRDYGVSLMLAPHFFVTDLKRW